MDVTMSSDKPDTLMDALARGRLNAAQLEEYLSQHPQARAECEEEFALNQLLEQLPDAPVSSNFTARVVDAALAEKRGAAKSSGGQWAGLFSGWLPRLVGASAILVAALISYHQHQLATHKDAARNLAEAARVVDGTPLDVLENFEAIQRLGMVPQEPHNDLIAALQ
jgi:anti-sigma factor RsiW